MNKFNELLKDCLTSPSMSPDIYEDIVKTVNENTWTRINRFMSPTVIRHYLFEAEKCLLYDKYVSIFKKSLNEIFNQLRDEIRYLASGYDGQCLKCFDTVPDTYELLPFIGYVSDDVLTFYVCCKSTDDMSPCIDMSYVVKKAVDAVLDGMCDTSVVPCVSISSEKNASAYEDTVNSQQLVTVNIRLRYKNQNGYVKFAEKENSSLLNTLKNWSDLARNIKITTCDTSSIYPDWSNSTFLNYSYSPKEDQEVMNYTIKFPKYFKNNYN